MSGVWKTDFIFTTCAPGAESALKAEVAREWPLLRLAYSRPGFVTYKLEAESPTAEPLHPDFDLKTAFAHSYGLSLGKAAGDSFEERVAAVIQTAQKLARGGGVWRLHVWEREQALEEQIRVEGPLPREIERAVRAKIPLFEREAEPKVGDMVFDLVLVEEKEWWMGFHVHSSTHRIWPGGRATVTMSAAAPSRAYLKLLEGVAWARLELKKGETALELGSAPGGASMALLEVGLSVIGVDPAQMDARLMREKQFRHLRKQALQVDPTELGKVDWLFCDMNVPPEEALGAVRHFVRHLRLKGGLVTLKLKDWDSAGALPSLLERAKELGFGNVRVAHLFHNRCEVCLALS